MSISHMENKINLGRVQSSDIIKKRSEKNTGKKRNKETKLKMGLAQKLRWDKSKIIKDDK